MRRTRRFISHLPFTWRSRIKIARANTFESFGSSRYSFPALNNLDHALIGILPERGTFIELGANDGYSQSNTYALERFYGWRGVLIEPLPSLYQICKSHRREAEVFNLACVGEGGPTALTIIDRGLTSFGPELLGRTESERRAGGATRTVKVGTATLSEIIDRSTLERITFLSLDVEGAELHVLAGLDLERHCPDYLLVETDQLDSVASVLAGHLALSQQLSHHDYLFVKEGLI